jgi:hypothetical protein
MSHFQFFDQRWKGWTKTNKMQICIFVVERERKQILPKLFKWIFYFGRNIYMGSDTIELFFPSLMVLW